MVSGRVQSMYSMKEVAPLQSCPVSCTANSTGTLQIRRLHAPGRMPPALILDGNSETATLAHVFDPPGT
eukprot:1172957-Prymnesium_polylepis.1